MKKKVNNWKPGHPGVGGIIVSVAMMLCLASSVFANGTETLGPPSIAIATGSGIAIGGAGLFSQPGTIEVNVPGDATVKQVILYWEGQHTQAGNGDNTINVNGQPIIGEAIGGPTLFFTAGDGQHYTTSYRADITAGGFVNPGGEQPDGGRAGVRFQSAAQQRRGRAGGV